jgi:ribosome-associated protein
LGVELLTLRSELIARLNTQGHMTDQLREALAEARRITNFEGKRRQMQYVGKLMRKLSEESIEAVKDALNEQRMGSTKDTLALHLAESWRDRLLAEDTALQEWMNEYPTTDSQQLRALVRQARKDDVTSKADIAKGLLPRQSRAFREIFQLIKEQFNLVDDVLHTPEEDEDSYKP